MAISYILKAILSILHSLILPTVQFDWSFKIIISVIFAIIVAFCIVRISENKIVGTIVETFGHKSLNNSVWKDYIDFEKGTKLHITCDHGKTQYFGDFLYCEENGLDSWFVLENYSVFIDGKDVYSPCIDNPNNKLVIRLNEVDRVELYYNK